jgi:two-component system copper resistance phosphate regulon response regulator CusR
MRLLLIEDELKAGESIKQGLTEAGFCVSLVSNGLEGHHLALTARFDLVILDVMLPGMDGWEILQSLRQAGNQCPVLFLTAKDSVSDRVKGLELGADDYLVKPFAFVELLARIRSIVRRDKLSVADDKFVLGDLLVNVATRKMTRAGKRISLSQKEFLLLELFLRRQGEVLTRSIIAAEVWDMHFDSDTNVIDVAVRRLRAKIDDDYPQKLIHTIRGLGYKLELQGAKN